jgi:hypothetical protein
MAVKESGKATGMKHLHIFFSNWVWVPDYVLSAKWESISSAYNVDVARVWGKSVASYVSKYVSKGLASGIVLRKLVTYSRGFPKLPSSRILLMDDWTGTARPTRSVAILRDGTLVQWWGNLGPCGCFGCEQLLE